MLTGAALLRWNSTVNRLLLLASYLICALILACNGDEDRRAVATVTPDQEVSATTPRPAGLTGLPTSVQLERVFPKLTFENMTGLYPSDDGTWFVTEQPGRIVHITPSASGAATSLVLDITKKVSTTVNEEGLLGFALSSDFAQTGEYYVYYSAPDPQRTVLSRFLLSSGSDGSVGETVLLQVPQPYSNHNGGQIVIGPDGDLYVGLGDGGGAGDPEGNGQNIASLLGSILRLDVSGNVGYTVPSDNPFVGETGARGEIWAYGLRNPWRFSFDSATGDLWVGDVGQDSREEVDVVVKGGNYGWNVMEGFDCLSSNSGCSQDDFLLPIFDYGHRNGACSITGGFVYRGSAIPELRGAYVYSDYCSGKIWALRYNGNAVTERAEIADAGFNVSSFAQDKDGELYVLQYAGDGGIYKLVP